MFARQVFRAATATVGRAAVAPAGKPSAFLLLYPPIPSPALR